MGKLWYTFIFADGFSVTCRGMDDTEMYVKEQQHGKLLRRVPVI